MIYNIVQKLNNQIVFKQVHIFVYYLIIWPSYNLLNLFLSKLAGLKFPNENPVSQANRM